MFEPVGTVSDYKYSKALSEYKRLELARDERFLIKPSKWIKGNKMGFNGLKDEKDRASVMLYLNQNNDNQKHNLSKQYIKILFVHSYSVYY